MLKDNRVVAPDKGRYWNDFYDKGQIGKMAAPSQFAAFVLQEAADVGLIIDIGCGSGRDSFFFARHGLKVAAIDGSGSAIESGRRAQMDAGLPNLSFHSVAVGSSAFPETVKSMRHSHLAETTLVYARFFLHALTDDEEDDFFECLADTLQPGDLIALEYRTVRDASGAKVTPDHYRRFVDQHRFSRKQAAVALSCSMLSRDMDLPNTSRTTLTLSDACCERFDFLEARMDAFFDKYCSLVAMGDYDSAYGGMLAENDLSAEEKRSIIAAINSGHLSDKGLEWGNHGIRRTFRFWTEEQKIGMVRQANRLTDALTRFTPYVSFGFGSVLGFVRDGGLIPHDDDLDLIIALPSEGATFQKTKQELRDFLEENGFTPHGFDGNFPTHFGVNEGNGTAVDVFIGFIEGDRVAWFPSGRSGMHVSDIFPTSSMTILGETVRVPANPERYLEATYGASWREPIANWHHPWDLSEFLDFWEPASEVEPTTDELTSGLIECQADLGVPQDVANGIGIEPGTEVSDKKAAARAPQPF